MNRWENDESAINGDAIATICSKADVSTDWMLFGRGQILNSDKESLGIVESLIERIEDLERQSAINQSSIVRNGTQVGLLRHEFEGKISKPSDERERKLG